MGTLSLSHSDRTIPQWQILQSYLNRKWEGAWWWQLVPRWGLISHNSAHSAIAPEERDLSLARHSQGLWPSWGYLWYTGFIRQPAQPMDSSFCTPTLRALKLIHEAFRTPKPLTSHFLTHLCSKLTVASWCAHNEFNSSCLSASCFLLLNGGKKKTQHKKTTKIA